MPDGEETYEEFRERFYALVTEGKRKGWIVGDGAGVWVGHAAPVIQLGSRGEDDAL